jgi:fructokinase
VTIPVRPEELRCVGIGEVLWDLLPGGRSLGGAPANVAAHASQLGARGFAVSAIGNDDDGRGVLEQLSLMQVDVTGVRVVDGLPTGVVDVRVDDAGAPSFTIRAPSAWDAIEVDEESTRLAERADAVIFGTLAQRDPRSRKSIAKFLGATSPSCLRILDINLRPPYIFMDVILQSLELADVLKLNDDELPMLAGMLNLTGDETTLLQDLRARFDLDLLVYTRGARGSRMLTPDQDEGHAGFSANVVDTVGAGDAFTAAVTIGMLEGLPLRRIQELANLVAAFVCSRKGAVPRLPEEITKEFRSTRDSSRAWTSWRSVS